MDRGNKIILGVVIVSTFVLLAVINFRAEKVENALQGVSAEMVAIHATPTASPSAALSPTEAPVKKVAPTVNRVTTAPSPTVK